MNEHNFLFDVLDQVGLIYYQELNISYLAALSEINNNLNNNLYNEKISDELKKKLEFIYKPLLNKDYSKESLRFALELYSIKGLKHLNYSKFLMTPDFVNYIFAIIVNELFQVQELTILDPNLGTANLLATIANNYNGELKLVGIDFDHVLVNLGSSFLSLLQYYNQIYFQDTFMSINLQADLIVSDLDQYLANEVPIIEEYDLDNYQYLVILKHLENLKEYGYFIYLVDNDFFSKDYKKFQEYINVDARVLGVIRLPEELTQEEHLGKSIIIGKKTKENIEDIKLVQFSGLGAIEIKASINKIKTLIKSIKENK